MMREFKLAGTCLCAALLTVPIGCETSGQTFALGGAGIGALAGQAIGGNTTATLVGAAIGAGVGYVIGNEDDKKKASTMSVDYHQEVGPLGGTRWRLTKLVPDDAVEPYTSKVVEFKLNGDVVTTTTGKDGEVDVSQEEYRVVGDTLIVNRPGYLINAKIELTGHRLSLTCQKWSAVLQRL